MFTPLRCTVLLGLVATIITPCAVAGHVSVPNNFTPNTPAVAAQVNANFGTLVTNENSHDDRIAALEATVATLQTQLAALQANNVASLGQYVDVVTVDGKPTLLFHDVNIQIVNGMESTATTNGLGNLTIGYNTISEYALEFCSKPEYYDDTSCAAHGGIWAKNQRSGSHNLILGRSNAYTAYGGLVVGEDNVINNEFVTITAGFYNIASGAFSAISGGTNNRTIGRDSSVTGGYLNRASGEASSITGGAYNRAEALGSSVSGGGGKDVNNTPSPNVANGDFSSISGGANNLASAAQASISGGDGNVASAEYASVCGGDSNTASGLFSSVAGGQFNVASGNWASVSGGNNVTASAQLGWATAGYHTP